MFCVSYITNTKGGIPLNKLKEIRKKYGISQQELSKTVKVSQQTISAWERGYRTPNTKKMQQIEYLFHIPKEDIFFAAFSYVR